MGEGWLFNGRWAPELDKGISRGFDIPRDDDLAMSFDAAGWAW